MKEQEGQEGNDKDELMKQAVPLTQPWQEEGEEERKQATTHISVPLDVDLASSSEEDGGRDKGK